MASCALHHVYHTPYTLHHGSKSSTHQKGRPTATISTATSGIQGPTLRQHLMASHRALQSRFLGWAASSSVDLHAVHSNIWCCLACGAGGHAGREQLANGRQGLSWSKLVLSDALLLAFQAISRLPAAHDCWLPHPVALTSPVTVSLTL